MFGGVDVFCVVVHGVEGSMFVPHTIKYDILIAN